MADRCEIPPPVWTCSRPRGHEGPCAASPEDRADTAARGMFAALEDLERALDEPNPMTERLMVLAATALEWSEKKQDDYQLRMACESFRGFVAGILTIEDQRDAVEVRDRITHAEGRRVKWEDIKRRLGL